MSVSGALTRKYRASIASGWSPAGAADLRPLGLRLGQPTTLRFRNDAKIALGTQIFAVFYDEPSHQWLASSPATVIWRVWHAAQVMPVISLPAGPDAVKPIGNPVVTSGLGR